MTSIVLNGPGDWDEWLGVIRTQAKAAEVWSYIDPVVDGQELPVLTEPHLPTLADIKGERPLLTITTPASTTASSWTDSAVADATMVDTSPLTKDEEDDLKMRWYVYKQDIAEHERKKAAIRGLPTTIQETISRPYLIYTLKCDTPHQMLRALKKRVAPTDRLRMIVLSNKYQKLHKFGRNQNLEVWLQQWEMTYTEGQKLGLPEVANQRPLYDFIQSVSTLEPDFASFWKGEINRLLHKGKQHKLPDLFDLIEVFRNQRRESEAEKGKASLSAFPTSFQGRSVGNEERNYNKDRKKKKDKVKTCVCGDKHLWKDCSYLIEANRPQGWKPDEELQKKITEKLEKNAWLKKAIGRVKDSEKKQSDSILLEIGPVGISGHTVGLCGYTVGLCGYTVGIC